MEPVQSTVEILYLKVTNKTLNQAWVNWAVEMLVAGFDGDYLAVLANESEPNFENYDLAEKVLNELGIPFTDKEAIINNYILYLVNKLLNSEMGSDKALRILCDICIDLNYPASLMDFYFLCYAKCDLDYYGDQGYWPDATRDNIEGIIRAQFIAWKNTYGV